MGEYKRMLLAVIAASVFIYLWTVFVSKPPPRSGGAPVSAPDSVLAGDTTRTPSSINPPTETSPLPEAAQSAAALSRPEPSTGVAMQGGWQAVPDWNHMDVETGICRGVLAESGGGLSAWELQEFPDQQGGPVDLVNLEHGGACDLRLELVSGNALLSFDEVDFAQREVSEQEIARRQQVAHREVARQGTPPQETDKDRPVVAKVVRLSASDTAGASVAKTYTFYRDEYFFDLDVDVSGFSSGNSLSCALSWSYGLPVTEANEKGDLANFAAMSLLGEEFVKDKLGDFGKEPVRPHEGSVRWTGVRSKYFAVAMVPLHSQGKTVRTWGSPDLDLVAAQLFVPMEITGAGAAAAKFRVYAGPMDYDHLSALRVGLEKDVYQRFKFMAPLNHLVFALMTWTHSLVPNYGLVIIIVSVLIKLVFYPLTRSSLKSMQAMKTVQPELEALKKKYKGDPKKLNQEQMELFRKHKVNPMGGCLPILVQMPIFFALYNVLVESVQLRRAPFVSWIDDLSAPDTLFHFGTFPVHVLPIIMGATQIAQPAMGPSNDSRQQMMKYIMPIFMLVIFYGLPSGLVLYWTVNNVLTAVQQYLMNRSEKPGTDAAAFAPSKPAAQRGKSK